MTPVHSSLDGGAITRRAVLAAAGSAAGIAAGAGSGNAQEITREMVIPAVEEFEGNYVGQFITVHGDVEGDVNPEQVHESCTDLGWSVEETATRSGQLTDRRSDAPIAVRLPVYFDANEDEVEEDSFFIINGATPCQGDYVVIQGEEVDVRSVVLEEAGPTVTEGQDATATETEQPGFGLLGGALGVGGALALRYLTERE